MPEIKISKIKARRGNDNQRRTVVFDQGEFVFANDTGRLYIGTGTTLGGLVVGSKIHPPMSNYTSLSTLVAEVGDIVNVSTKYYQLTAADFGNINSWADISTKIDSTFFQYDSNNQITLKNNSIPVTYLESSAISNGLKIEDDVLQTNFNTKSIELSSGALSIKAGGIDEREIKSTTFFNGVSGGNGNKIGIAFDPSQFQIVSGLLTLTTTDFSFNSLQSSWFGSGLLVNPETEEISTVLVDVDDDSLVKSAGGTISMSADIVPGTNELSNITIDKFGRVVEHKTSIFGALTGMSTLNSNNSLSAIFNGTPAHSLSGPIAGLPIAQFEAIDDFGDVVSLSSAGFITFEGETTTRNGETVGRFAIPIFAY